MARPGVVRIPSLSERHHDIPLLFYITLSGISGKKDAKEFHKHYRIDLDAYRALMNKAIKWPGNLRQLQTVTYEIYKRSTGLAASGGGLGVPPIKITRITVEDVLTEHFGIPGSTNP